MTKFLVVTIAIFVIAVGFKVTNKNDFATSFVREKNDAKKNITTTSPQYKNINFTRNNIPVEPNAICGNLDDIMKRKKLIVCALKTEKDPIFQIKVNDQYVGESIRFASALGKALGVQVVYKMSYQSYNDVVDAIYNGEGDIGIAELSYTPGRARKVAYSSPYIISRKVVLVDRAAMMNEDRNTLDKLLNNSEAKIAVMKNTSYENYAETLFPKAQILQETEWENGAIQKLKKGKVMAVIWDELRIKPLISAHPELLLKFLPIILKDGKDPISAITNTKEYSLNSFINKFLENDYKISTINEALSTYKNYIKNNK